MTERKGKFFDIIFAIDNDEELNYSSEDIDRDDYIFMIILQKKRKKIMMKNFDKVYIERKHLLAIEINQEINKDDYIDYKFPIIIEVQDIDYNNFFGNISIEMTRYSLKDEYTSNEIDIYENIIVKAFNTVFNDLKTTHKNKEISFHCVNIYLNCIPKRADMYQI